MRIFLSTSLKDKIKGKYISLDNDFLTELFTKKEVLIVFFSILSESYFLIDPLIQFEFLRNIFMPKQRELRHIFLSKDVFTIVTAHQQIFMKLQENALLLAQIYSHKNQAVKASYIDLNLAARSMLQGTYIISANKTDYPSCIFNVESIFPIEQGDDTFKNYYLLKFNEKKFDKSYQDFLKINPQ